MAVDVVVLGAGIIGVSVALQLSRRGKSVVLLDRRGPGEETSFGNAGLIQREGVEPYGFPQDVGLLLKYSLNNRIDAHYHLRAMPKIAPSSDATGFIPLPLAMLRSRALMRPLSNIRCLNTKS